jgi:hypothetical protein
LLAAIMNDEKAPHGARLLQPKRFCRGAGEIHCADRPEHWSDLSEKWLDTLEGEGKAARLCTHNGH